MIKNIYFNIYWRRVSQISNLGCFRGCRIWALAQAALWCSSRNYRFDAGLWQKGLESKWDGSSWCLLYRKLVSIIRFQNITTNCTSGLSRTWSVLICLTWVLFFDIAVIMQRFEFLQIFREQWSSCDLDRSWVVMGGVAIYKFHCLFDPRR